jgi:hypothetical protein
VTTSETGGSVMAAAVAAERLARELLDKLGVTIIS